MKEVLAPGFSLALLRHCSYLGVNQQREDLCLGLSNNLIFKNKMVK